MSIIVFLVISVAIFVVGFVVGITIGNTLTSMKYGTKIDNLNSVIDDREDELNRVYEDIRKGKYSKKNVR